MVRWSLILVQLVVIEPVAPCSSDRPWKLAIDMAAPPPHSPSADGSHPFTTRKASTPMAPRLNSVAEGWIRSRALVKLTQIGGAAAQDAIVRREVVIDLGVVLVVFDTILVCRRIDNPRRRQRFPAGLPPVRQLAEVALAH